MTGPVGGVADLLAVRIRRRGPLPFDEVIEAALYDPTYGFYSTGGAAGRRADFLTSPEVGPLFGAALARALDSWWADAGSPDPFVVVEAGAGRGALAQTVLAAEPACLSALRYVLVERSPVLRARQSEHLSLQPPALAFEPTGPGAPCEPGTGPVVVGLTDLPSLEAPAVVLANELLDNLAFRILARSAAGWAEVRVGLDDGGQLCEWPVPAGERLVGLVERLAPAAPVGARVPVQDEAAGWLRAAFDTAGPEGRVVAIDYAATTAELADRPWTDWLRTYAGHQRGSDPLDHLGHQDITADVCTDQLTRVRPPSEDRSQAQFLRAHGIEQLVEEGRRTWSERANTADLVALRARSRVAEADALCDPTGLGAFRVLEWSA